MRTAISAFEAVDPTLLAASRTLGAGPARTFGRVALPLAAGGLGAGAALAFARGLGEFGATIMFAGSLQGVTQTLSLAIYQQFDVDFDGALAISAALVLVSAALLLLVKLRLPMASLQLEHPPSPSRVPPRGEPRGSAAGTLALVGPSGAGKTTVLRVVAGLLRPERGAVALDEEVWLDTSRGVDLPPERRSVGLVFQEYALFPHMTVRANVGYGARRSDRVDELLERLRIGHLADARAGRHLRRRASARGARPGACARSRRPAARRAALRARRAHEGRCARGAAGRDRLRQAADAARHARLRGRRHVGRPGRRDRRRATTAARSPRRPRRRPRWIPS